MESQTAQSGGPRGTVRRRLGFPAVVLVALMIGTCSSPPGLLVQIRELGALKVATRNSPTAYFEGAAGPDGPEYELAVGFARALGVRLELRVLPSGTAALEDVLSNRSHIAAAGIVANEPRRATGLFGPVYRRISQHVIGHVRGPLPAGPAELAGRRIAVIRGSTHAASLARLAATVPGLQWTELDNVDQLDLLARVAGGAIDLTIADSSEFALGRYFHPELRPAFTLLESEEIAWALGPRSHELLAFVQRYFDGLAGDGRLASILARHDRTMARVDRIDAAAFVEDVRRTLPAYRPWFEEAAAETGVDWRLLAAIGYQESQWDHSAVSPTGVRGLMMLTEETARRVGVTNRDNPRHSIQGGARYLVLVRDTIPQRIPEPDRTWFALASYNIGYGHLEDARVLAQRQGKDPDSWDEVRAVLPLLAQERWFTQTSRGYARGWEAVGFVRRVQTYLEVLEWMTGAPGGPLRVPVSAGTTAGQPPAG